MQEEKVIDVKGIIEKFINADEPEISQEEAINKFQEKDILKTLKKNSDNNENDDEQSEEEQHNERIKKELIASLERVKKLEQQIYGRDKIEVKSKKEDKEKTNPKMQIKEEQSVSRKVTTKEKEQKERE